MFSVVLTFVRERLIPTRARSEEAKPFPRCHQASYGLRSSKVINSSLTCDTVCAFVTLIFTVTSQGRDLRIFHAPLYELL